MSLGDKLVDLDLELMVPIVRDALRNKTFRQEFMSRSGINSQRLNSLSRKVGRIWRARQRISDPS